MTLIDSLINVDLGGWDEPEVVVGVAGLLFILIGGAARYVARSRATRRAQAQLVGAWLDRLRDGRVVVTVRNRSDQPVTDVVIHVSRRLGESAPVPHLPQEPDLQLIAAPMIGPERTVKFPVDMATDEDARSLEAKTHFRDAAGTSWIRDERGKLLRHKTGRLEADAFGVSRVSGWAEAMEHAVSPASEPAGVEVPTVAYTTHTMSSAGGNQLTVSLSPL